jgi:hypothetical protein
MRSGLCSPNTIRTAARLDRPRNHSTGSYSRKLPGTNMSSKSEVLPESESTQASVIMEDWYKRVRINIDTHNYAERLYDRWNTVLAITNICSIVTVAVLASSVSISSAGMRVLVLALGLTSAVASCLQLQLSTVRRRRPTGLQLDNTARCGARSK